MIKREFLEKTLGLKNLKENSENFIASCPFAFLHEKGEDKNPSFTMHKETGVWHCFSCGRRGNFSQLISSVLGVTWDQAQSVIQGQDTVSIQSRILGRVQKLLQVVDKQAIVENGFVFSDLTAEAKQFLVNRGFKKIDEMIEEFSLLFCIEGRYKDRIVIPVFVDNQRISFIARDITNTSSKKYLMQRGFQKKESLFNLDKITGDEAWLVEGCFDVLKLWEFGIKNVVAVLGCEISNEQISLLLKKKVKKVVLLFDNDLSGKKATDEFVQKYSQYFQTYVGALPSSCKDPGELSTVEEISFIKSNLTLTKFLGFKEPVSKSDLVKQKLNKILGF